MVFERKKKVMNKNKMKKKLFSRSFKLKYIKF